MRNKIPFLRPASLATDSASSYSVIMHALEAYESQGIVFSRVVLLQPTSPLRNVGDINNALDLWTPRHRHGGVCEARTNPYYNGFETGDEGFLHVSKGDGHITRRQDAPKVWEYNGAVYVMTVESLKKDQCLYLKNIALTNACRTLCRSRHSARLEDC